MTWSKPDFVEISLNMEVTGYVNADDAFSDASEKRSPSDVPEKGQPSNASPKRR